MHVKIDHNYIHVFTLHTNICYIHLVQADCVHKSMVAMFRRSNMKKGTTLTYEVITFQRELFLKYVLIK